MYDSGITVIGEYTFIYAGHSSADKTCSTHGVVLCLNKQATAAWNNLGSTWEAVSERIVMARLECNQSTSRSSLSMHLSIQRINKWPVQRPVRK